MSYFLDTYGTPLIFFGGFVVLFVLLIVYCSAVDWISRRLRLKRKMSSVLLGAAIFGAGITLCLFMLYVPDFLNDGRIENIYIVNKDNDVRLVVWFIREDTPAGMTRVYSHRIKSFDLPTGKCRARLTLSRRHPFNDYAIYGPFDQFAWGYSEQNGIAFLDMFAATRIAGEKDILERNPVLGDKVRLTKGPNMKRFDPVVFGLFVYTASGDIYRVNPDLKAENVRTLDLKNQRHDKATCAVCRHDAQFIDLKKAVTGWGYDAASKKVLRYRDEGGRTLNTIELNEMFEDKRYVYAAARIKDEIWLFVTMKRYKLSAIRTDAGSGQILETVNYF